MTKIYDPSGEELTPREIARWANKVHRQAGGKGNPFSAEHFSRTSISLMYPERLKGPLCDCGADEDGFSNGEFILLPLEDEAVVEGGKAYMKCRKCGAYSHL